MAEVRSADPAAIERVLSRLVAGELALGRRQPQPVLGPDWMVRGESLAQETSWPAPGVWAVGIAATSASMRAERVDLIEQHACELGVVLVEAAGERLDQGGMPEPHSALGQGGQGLRVALAHDERLQYGPPRDHQDLGGRARDLDQGVL